MRRQEYCMLAGELREVREILRAGRELREVREILRADRGASGIDRNDFQAVKEPAEE